MGVKDNVGNFCLRTKSNMEVSFSGDIYENATQCSNRISVVSVKQNNPELTIKNPGQTPASRSDVKLSLPFLRKQRSQSPCREFTNCERAVLRVDIIVGSLIPQPLNV